MPRFPAPGAEVCPAPTLTAVPLVNSLTGLAVTSLPMPQVLTATGKLYLTLPALLAGIKSTLPVGVEAAMAPTGLAVNLSYSVAYTPPASFGLWPRRTVRIINESSVNQCPFVGPVTRPTGGTFNTRAELIAGVDSVDTQAYWLDWTGADCPVLVLYHPARATPTDIIVAKPTVVSTVKLVEATTLAQINCPARFPIYYAADGSEHLTLTSLAAKVQTALGAGYVVVPAPDGCNLLVRHAPEAAVPAPVQVFATEATLIPVKLDGVTVCPVPFPVRLASAPTGAQYSTMAQLAAGFQKKLPARSKVTPANACQFTVTYPVTATPPTAVDIATASTLVGTFATARSSAATGAAAFTAALPADDMYAASGLLDEQLWPASANLKQQLLDDMTKVHEGSLDGVPSSYDWATQPKKGGGYYSPGSYQAATVWGQVYSSTTPVTATVEIGNMKLAQLSASTGRWTILQSTKAQGGQNNDGSYYRADFAGNIQSPTAPGQTPTGTLTATPNPDWNFHFYPAGRGAIDNGDVAAMAMWYDARLVPGSDPRARYLAGAGGDYWQTLDSPYPSNTDIAIGRHRYLKNDRWITLTAHNMTPEQINSNPPPIVLAGGAVEAATAWLYDLRQENGQVPPSTVYRVRVTVAPEGRVFVALKNGPSGDQFLTPASRGGGLSASQVGYNSAVTDVPAQATTIEWDVPAGVTPANLCLMVQTPAAGRRALISNISFDTLGTPGGGETGGEPVSGAPVIATVPNQTTGVGTAVVVTFAVTNSPTSVTASHGSIAALGNGEWRLSYTPTATGTTTITLTATNAVGTGTKAVTVTATATAPPPPTGTASTLRQQLKDDASLAHEGKLDGVPDGYDWAFRPRIGVGNNPASGGYNAATAWGQVYSSYGSSNNPAPNTLVQVANLKLAVLSKSGTWSVIQSTRYEGGQGMDAGFYTADYQGNIGSPENPLILSDGTRAGAPNIKYNLHFYPQGRAAINNGDIAGIVAWFDARLVLKNSGGPDDRASARFLAGAGGDYWQTLDNPWPGNGDFAIGRHRWVRNEWQTFTAHTLTNAQIDANPPPISTFKTLSTVSTGGEPVSGSVWKTPSGRAIKVMPVGDSITAGQAESSVGWTTMPGRITGGRQILTVGSQTGFAGLKHEGHGAWCADDTNGRCTHTNGFHAGGVVQNLAGWLTTFQPDVMVLNIGTNDRYVVDGWSAAQIANAIGVILDIAKQTRPQTFVYVTGLRYLSEVPGGYTDNALLNTMIQDSITTRAANGDNVAYFNQYSTFSSSADFAGGNDYVHPSDQGISKMMDRTAVALNDLFAARA